MRGKLDEARPMLSYYRKEQIFFFFIFNTLGKTTSLEGALSLY
jgi:hypothetical protein